MASDAFRSAYRGASSEAVSIHIGENRAEEYIDSVEAAIDTLEEQLQAVVDNNKGIDFAQGDAAEVWHASTLNLRAAVASQDQDAASTPRSTLKDSPDVVYGDDGAQEAQLKYYGDAAATADALDEPGYAGMTKLGPAEQIDEVRERLYERADRVEESSPEQAEFLRRTADSTTDRLESDGIESVPLTRSDSSALVTDIRDDGVLDRERWGLTLDQQVDGGNVFTEGVEAFIGGAGMAFAMQVSGLAVGAIKKLMDDGTIDAGDLRDLAEGRATAVAKSSVAGAVAASITVAEAAGHLSALGLEGLDPTGAAALTVLIINAIPLAARAARGELGWGEATYRMSVSAAALGGGLTGAALGTFLIPIPIAGAVIGSVIGASLVRVGATVGESVVMGWAIDNGWTYFGVVSQDYRLPPEVRERLGLDSAELETAELDRPLLERPVLQRPILETAELDTTVRLVRRGVVSFRRVGYV